MNSRLAQTGLNRQRAFHFRQVIEFPHKGSVDVILESPEVVALQSKVPAARGNGISDRGTGESAVHIIVNFQALLLILLVSRGNQP